MKKLIAVAFAAVFILVTTAPAFADAAVPFRGAYGPLDFDEEYVPSLPTSGEPGLLVIIQIETNLGPVTETLEIPDSTVVFHGNGALHFQVPATWNFGGGNVLYTLATGVISFGSGNVTVNEKVIGGAGLYAGAAGTIHDTQFGHEQSAFPTFGGFIAGVIRLN